jgi:pyruvate dehydrogenase E2 component (dihydrolipoamide acetyltransferase)
MMMSSSIEVALVGAPYPDVAETPVFYLPDIGEGVAEGEIIAWLVPEGHAVQEDAPLLEVMTDKVTVEIPSPYTGVLVAQLAAAGGVVPVGSAIAQFRVGNQQGVDVANASDSSVAIVSSEPSLVSLEQVAALEALASSIVADASLVYEQPPAEAFQPEASLRRVLASPATRYFARTLGLALHTVKGSGVNGRITRQDVEAHVANPPLEALSAVKVIENQPQKTPESLPAHEAGSESVPLIPPVVSFPKTEYSSVHLLGQEPLTLPLTPLLTEDVRKPYQGIRKMIGDRLSQAKRTIPEFALIEEVNVSRLEQLRQELKPVFEAQGVKLSILPFVLRAVVKSLGAYPALNATLLEQEGVIVEKASINLGVAVDAPQGLVVPVIQRANGLSLKALAQEVQQKAQQARAGALSKAQVTGGTFTVTSIGGYGGLIGVPIINAPEVAILAVNQVRKKPVVNANNEIVVGDVLMLTLTVDHRVVDGALAAQFMTRLRQWLEHPASLLLE